MAGEGDKYKIKIVRTGIGDPFLLGKFQFDLEGALDPKTTPVQDLEIKVEFSLDNDDFHTYGNIQLKKNLSDWATNESQTATYYFGMPFDPGDGYETGQTIYLKLTFTASNAYIQLDGGSNNHSTYEMPFLTNSSTHFPSVPVYYYWEA